MSVTPAADAQVAPATPAAQVTFAIMKNRSLLIAIIVLSASLAPSVHAYQDKPLGLSAKGAALIAGYQLQARKTLPYFDEQLKSSKGRKFFVITKIYEKEVFEQIYVAVDARTDDGYRGHIASSPTGSVKFTKGADINVRAGEVADWCIVSSNGEEEGNVTGKALDALQSGVLVFIVSMQPDGGVFAHFKVVSVQNPQTRQSVIEIVAKETISTVEAEAVSRWGRLRAEDDKEKFQFILVKFPSWTIISE